MLILRHVAVKQVVFVKKDWSGFDQATGKDWELCGEEAVSDNDTSRQSVWSE